MHNLGHRWRGRRVLVTGCTGMLGSAVSRELLAAGVDVVGLIREHRAVPEYAHERFPGRFQLVRGRVEDRFRIYSALAIHESAALFHLAESDERGTTTVLEAAGSYQREMPVIAAQPTARNYIPKSLGRLGIARFGELFGPGDRNENHVIPATLAARLDGTRPPTFVNGPLTDYVFVNDAARACLMLADALAEPAHPRFVDATFRSGCEYAERAAADIIRETLDGRPVLQTMEPAAANPLGWTPAWNFRDALTETANWMREHRGSRADSAPRLRSAA